VTFAELAARCRACSDRKQAAEQDVARLTAALARAHNELRVAIVVEAEWDTRYRMIMNGGTVSGIEGPGK